MLNNVLVTVIFFICLLSFILVFSLMQTDVEERKYEFAVLRTLGLRNQSLVTLITVQTLTFAIPAVCLGFLAMHVLVAISEATLVEVLQMDVKVKIMRRTVFLGLITGFVIPFASNVVPIRQALGSSLRNALDKFRPSIDEIEVKMVRLENQGMSAS